ncbi:MAG: hypothetical protein CMF96_05470 [Candidatus Marinimicrobia bacterium]|nr:hypothetical protein [Candidatus Neomarinimicrobiota bacterium]
MWQGEKDYFQFEIGDIVSEDNSFVFWDDEPLIGLILDIKRHVYFLGSDDYEIYQDQLAIYWFKTKKLEYVPSDFVILFSR